MPERRPRQHRQLNEARMTVQGMKIEFDKEIERLDKPQTQIKFEMKTLTT